MLYNNKENEFNSLASDELKANKARLSHYGLTKSRRNKVHSLSYINMNEKSIKKQNNSYSNNPNCFYEYIDMVQNNQVVHWSRDSYGSRGTIPEMITVPSFQSARLYSSHSSNAMPYASGRSRVRRAREYHKKRSILREMQQAKKVEGIKEKIDEPLLKIRKEQKVQADQNSKGKKKVEHVKQKKQHATCQEGKMYRHNEYSKFHKNNLRTKYHTDKAGYVQNKTNKCVQKAQTSTVQDKKKRTQTRYKINQDTAGPDQKGIRYNIKDENKITRKKDKGNPNVNTKVKSNHHVHEAKVRTLQAALINENKEQSRQEKVDERKKKRRRSVCENENSKLKPPRKTQEIAKVSFSTSTEYTTSKGLIPILMSRSSHSLLEVNSINETSKYSSRPSKRIARSTMLGTAGYKQLPQHDEDVWVEIDVMRKKTSKLFPHQPTRSMFYSLNTKAAYWDEPPSGASNIILKPQ